MKRAWRVSGRALSVALAGLLLGGCGYAGGEKRGSGAAAYMDMQGAADRADAMLDATINAIVPKVRWVHDTTTAGSCDVSRRRTVTTIISDERRGNFLGVIHRFWKASGYEITTVHPSRDRPRMYAKSPDGFGISLVFGYKGQAFFEVASPCVTKSDVAEPAYPPGGIPTPNVRSAFWSVEEPVGGGGR